MSKFPSAWVKLAQAEMEQSKRYFPEREARLRELGLDPDDDDDWATPDYDLGLYDNEDTNLDYHPVAPTTDKYGLPFVAMCDDCFESPAIINEDGTGHFCEVCTRRRERRGLS